MADLTLLSGPNPLYPQPQRQSLDSSIIQERRYRQPSSPFRRAPSPLVQLPTFNSTEDLRRGQRETRDQDSRPAGGSAIPNYPGNTLLSPPVNTFGSSSRTRPRERRGHQRQRSSSAPPKPSASLPSSSRLSVDPYPHPKPKQRVINKKSHSLPSTLNAKPYAATTLVPPPPSLLRPTTFWRNTTRSGVSSSAYSPSCHLIRRSTFIAAGLDFDRPIADLSALRVESRIAAVVLVPS